MGPKKVRNSWKANNLQLGLWQVASGNWQATKRVTAIEKRRERQREREREMK